MDSWVGSRRFLPARVAPEIPAQKHEPVGHSLILRPTRQYLQIYIGVSVYVRIRARHFVLTCVTCDVYVLRAARGRSAGPLSRAEQFISRPRSGRDFCHHLYLYAYAYQPASVLPYPILPVAGRLGATWPIVVSCITVCAPPAGGITSCRKTWTDRCAVVPAPGPAPPLLRRPCPCRVKTQNPLIMCTDGILTVVQGVHVNPER
jgi:hypothetical protein